MNFDRIQVVGSGCPVVRYACVCCVVCYPRPAGGPSGMIVWQGQREYLQDSGMRGVHWGGAALLLNFDRIQVVGSGCPVVRYACVCCVVCYPRPAGGPSGMFVWQGQREYLQDSGNLCG